MKKMSISLPDDVIAFVEEQAASGGYRTGGEYVRELIRRDRDRERLRGLLAKGRASNEVGPANGSYFAALRTRVRDRSAAESKP